MRYSLRRKLATIVGLSTLGFLLLIGASVGIARLVEMELSKIQESYLPKIQVGPRLSNQLERMSRGFQDAVAVRDSKALAATEKLVADLLQQVRGASSALGPANVAELADAINDYYGTGYDVSRRLIEGETGEPLVVAMTKMQTQKARVSSLIKADSSFDQHDLQRAFATARNTENQAKSYQVAIGVICLAGIATVSIWLGSGLVRSLNELDRGFRRFGKGQFAEAMVVTTDDELSDVAHWANDMATSLQRLEAERHRADVQFRALVEFAPDAMVIVNQAGTIVLVNAQTEKVFGYSRTELVGQAVELLVPTRLRAGHPAHRATYGMASQVRPMGAGLDLYGRRKDGTEFPVEISLSPLDSVDGKLVASSIRDISRRKAIETSLKQSNQELESFSYTVAHDLRAPLRALHGFSRILLEDSPHELSAEAKGHLDRIAANAERMGQLIDSLLALSRLSKVEVRRESVNLSDMAEAVVLQLRDAEPARTVEFVCQPGLIANGDSILLRSVLDNLIGNAWKFTNASAHPHIEFGSSGPSTYFVQDNGAGFDMAYADKLFAPFQRLHQVREFPGTGIGLATAQRIIHRHGGRIWAEAAVDRGATFYFTLMEANGSRSS